METSPIRQMLQQALSNDQKIDKSEFEAIKAKIQEDKKVKPEELAPLVDALTQSQLAEGVVTQAIHFIAENQQAEKPEETKQTTESGQAGDAKPATAAQAETGSATEKAESKETPEEKSPWKTTYAIQGSFNHTSVSDGWTGQYGSEQSATRVEGSFQVDANYDKDRVTWNNRVLVEYGNTFVKGEEEHERAVSRNNLEATSEAGYKIEEKDNYTIEIPYASLYTKGPLDRIDGRKFRETTGAKITYTPNEHGAYSLKVGAGFQQTHDPNTQAFNNEFGVEVVAEAKQSFGFMTAPVVKATGAEAEDLAFLNRFEANAQVNAFNPLQDGFDVGNTDIGIRTGIRYYLNDAKSIWMGLGHQWEYGGKEGSTWERKFTADAGFKFE